MLLRNSKVIRHTISWLCRIFKKKSHDDCIFLFYLTVTNATLSVHRLSTDAGALLEGKTWAVILYFCVSRRRYLLLEYVLFLCCRKRAQYSDRSVGCMLLSAALQAANMGSRLFPPSNQSSLTHAPLTFYPTPILH